MRIVSHFLIPYFHSFENLSVVSICVKNMDYRYSAGLSIYYSLPVVMFKAPSHSKTVILSGGLYSEEGKVELCIRSSPCYLCPSLQQDRLLICFSLLLTYWCYSYQVPGGIDNFLIFIFFNVSFFIISYVRTMMKNTRWVRFQIKVNIHNFEHLMAPNCLKYSA